jgi:SprT-like family
LAVWLVAAAGVAGSIAMAYRIASTADRAKTSVEKPPAASPSPASAMQQVFDRVKGRVSDPDLASGYDDLNDQYFDDRLPRDVVVRWDDHLEDMGPLIADGFRLEGLTDGRIILINPAIQRERAELRRTLCHEMVHVQVWGRDSGHGAVFQQALRAIWERGAFSGLLATDEEKDQMRDTLRRLSERIAMEQRDHTPEGIGRANESIVDYNRLVERYNLMIAYPDGLDRERASRRE